MLSQNIIAKTDRLQRKTNIQKLDYLYYLDFGWFMHHNVGTCLWHVSNALIHCLSLKKVDS